MKYATNPKYNANSVDINGGTIDGAVIGGTTPAAGKFTQVGVGKTPTAMIDAAGSIVSTGADLTNQANQMAMDFVSPNGRILSYGIDVSTVGGILFVQRSSNASVNRTGLNITVDSNILPGTDDFQDLGSSSYRYDDIYATNTTIQSSDARLKENIAESDLGLDFINAVKPVSYKWKDYEVPAVFNEEGEEVHPSRTKTHTRRHYGMTAQQVEAALAGKDFAGLIYDEAVDRYGLRYAEFIAPLIKAVQELTTRVIELEKGNA